MADATVPTTSKAASAAKDAVNAADQAAQNAKEKIEYVAARTDKEVTALTKGITFPKVVRTVQTTAMVITGFTLAPVATSAVVGGLLAAKGAKAADSALREHYTSQLVEDLASTKE